MASVPSVQQANVALVLLTSQLLATSSSSIPLSSFLDTTLGLTFLHSPLSSPRSFSAVSCPALSHSLCPQAGVLTAPPSLSSCCARGGCTPEVSAPPTLGSSITGPPSPCSIRPRGANDFLCCWPRAHTYGSFPQHRPPPSDSLSVVSLTVPSLSCRPPDLAQHSSSSTSQSPALPSLRAHILYLLNTDEPQRLVQAALLSSIHALNLVISSTP